MVLSMSSQQAKVEEIVRDRGRGRVRQAEGHYIGGAFRRSVGGNTLFSVDPLYAQPCFVISDGGAEDIAAAANAAQCAFQAVWAALSASERGRVMHRWSQLIKHDAAVIAALESLENGKLYDEMLAQALFSANTLEYFAGLVDKIEGRVIPVERTSVLNYTLDEPLGVVGIITPWNSPLYLTMMAMAPALAAGNTIVVKPSEVASSGILHAASLAKKAGLPDGVVNIVTGGTAAGAALVDNPVIEHIVFTGGSAAGAQVMKAAAKRMKGVTLELGGKSPNIVFEDAPMEQAKGGLVAGVFAAAGQTCVAGSRILVHASRFDEIADHLRKVAADIRMGDPFDSTTQMGPIATTEQLKRIANMVDEAVADGSEVLAGGGAYQHEAFRDGTFFKPTVLASVPKDSLLAREEVFGPVAALIPFHSEEEAVQLANDSPYGLAAGVWTSNFSRAHRLARNLRAGTVWLNTYRRMTYNSPFGGYKSSGIGRLNGMEAIAKFRQTKSVWCELGQEVQKPFGLG